MQTPLSPLFPALQLTLSPARSNGITGEETQLIPQLPDKPLTQTSSIQVYVIPAELHLFVEGFQSQEYSERPPSLLRGCLYIRVLKPSKIKEIKLAFKGQLKTDWPEGIPPKKNTYSEITDIVSHTWPFYQQEVPLPNGGADIFHPLSKSSNDQDVSHLSLSDSMARTNSPMPNHGADNISLNHTNGGLGGNFFTRNLSPATNFIRRTASPVGGHSNDSFTDLTTSITAPDLDSTKPGHFPVGNYIYNFEQAIHPSVPETTNVTFGSVNYYLEAEILRIGTFKSNLTARLPIEIIRTPSESNMEENEPIVITRDWEDQLRYDIVVGGKSIVLDSYLPLAFRFVPLWGKVALHRIRVYLTENLEYYCQNKKVHRMEPPRKYLLLEHKSKKGQSLLSKSGGMAVEEDEDDEILPRELEFQLFVPKVLNDKYNHQIHPDTSFEEIQAHHWIKICLRISKLDPEHPEKRKHYEISIDSPLHILSPYAAHGNTLLPAYDNHENQLPQYTPSSPPLSPGVTPIDNTTNNDFHNKLPTLSNSALNMTNSLDQVMEDRPPSRSQTPVEFHHLNSSTNNDEPIARDGDMHLDANLYKPKEDSSDPHLHSPQALPHPGTFMSPLSSPLQRPIHVLRNPSFNPPPFNADIAPPELTSELPPAYNEEDPTLSLSPLRIDDPSTRGRSTNNGSSFEQEQSEHSIQVIPPTPVQETPVRDLLSQQLASAHNSNHASSHHGSTSGKTSMRNSTDSKTKLDTSNRSSTSHYHDSSNEVPILDSNASKRILDDGEDLTDSKDAPIQAPHLPLQQPLNFTNPSSPSRRLSTTSHFSANSRHSSITSLNSSIRSDDYPPEQTVPLLALESNSSQTALSSGNLGNGFSPPTSMQNRNSSVHSLLQDATRRPSNYQNMSTRIMNMVDGDLSDENNKIYGNLLNLRNPKLKKHYQNETIPQTPSINVSDVPEEDDLEADSKDEQKHNQEFNQNKNTIVNDTGSDLQSMVNIEIGDSNKNTHHDEESGQLDFRNIQPNELRNSNRSSSSYESEVAIDESNNVRNKSNDSQIRAESENIPGFNYGYII